mmetsp:Transcript_19400/g.32221  ORF Transcript_19400/g.32221 Transcript_19400/m.32221 type:complete len:117 (-) Transcript_19400:2122-2472(-)
MEPSTKCSAAAYKGFQLIYMVLLVSTGTCPTSRGALFLKRLDSGLVMSHMQMEDFVHLRVKKYHVPMMRILSGDTDVAAIQFMASVSMRRLPPRVIVLLEKSLIVNPWMQALGIPA